MRAIRFRQCGDPATVLTLDDIDRPTAGRGEVLVRMLASPINPSDLLFVEGKYAKPSVFPTTPGFEGVGIVEASGGGLFGKWLVGKRVAVLSRHGGNWAEQVVISEKQVIPLPGDLSVEQSATFFVNPMTAVVMTRKVLAVPKGEWLVQSAAASSLGRMIIRLAAHDGFRTLNVVRRESQVEELKRLGANEVLKFDAEADDPDVLVESLSRITGGVKYSVDPVGGVVGSSLAISLTTGGRLLTYGTLTDEPLSIPPRVLIGHQSSVAGFWLGPWMEGQSIVQKLRLIHRVKTLIRSGVLSSEISACFGLHQVDEAVAAATVGGSKVLFDMSREVS